MLVSDFCQEELTSDFYTITGIKLKDTQGKEEKKKASTISSTAAKYGSYRRAKETMPNVRRRIPRQLTPLETDLKQVNLIKIDDLKRDSEKTFS